jgi:hypothetical protein
MKIVDRARILLSGRTCDKCAYFGTFPVLTIQYCKLKSNKAAYPCPKTFTCKEWDSEIDEKKIQAYIDKRSKHDRR